MRPKGGQSTLGPGGTWQDLAHNGMISMHRLTGLHTLADLLPLIPFSLFRYPVPVKLSTCKRARCLEALSARCRHRGCLTQLRGYRGLTGAHCGLILGDRGDKRGLNPTSVPQVLRLKETAAERPLCNYVPSLGGMTFFTYGSTSCEEMPNLECLSSV